MNPKTLTLIIAAVTIAADAGATIGGLLPPAWALVVGALVAGLVAIDRALHNVAQGVSLKSYLTSPSAWAAALVIVASIISAGARVVPVAYATGVAVFAAMVLRVARVLQSALQPAGGQMLAATPGGLGTGAIPSTAAQQSGKVVSLPSTPTPPRGSPGPSSAGPVVRKGTGYGDKGSATIVQFLVLAAIAAAMVLLFAIPAKAQTLGHCLLTNADGTCKLVVQPDIIKPVLDLNLKTGKVSGGIDVAALGACWGATYQPAAWYASGFDLCFNLVGSQTSPTVLYPSGTVHFLSYGMIGAGPYCAADGVNGAFECQWHLLLGGNLALDFGPNASAAAAKKAKAERDASAEQTK
ncbi:MAG: hypothetical protein ACLQIJ_13605 [Polyangia bacterium]